MHMDSIHMDKIISIQCNSTSFFFSGLARTWCCGSRQAPPWPSVPMPAPCCSAAWTSSSRQSPKRRGSRCASRCSRKVGIGYWMPVDYWGEQTKPVSTVTIPMCGVLSDARTVCIVNISVSQGIIICDT